MAACITSSTSESARSRRGGCLSHILPSILKAARCPGRFEVHAQWGAVFGLSSASKQLLPSERSRAEQRHLPPCSLKSRTARTYGGDKCIIISPLSWRVMFEEVFRSGASLLAASADLLAFQTV